MTTAGIFGAAVVIVRAGERRDAHGNHVTDWSAASRTTAAGVSVQPITQDEDTSGARPTITSGWRLYSRPGVDLDLRASDRVEWDGRTCEVVGEVARWPDPFTAGRVHHVEAVLQEILS